MSLSYFLQFVVLASASRCAWRVLLR